MRADRPRLSREEIVSAGFMLLDEIGLPALSVRRLASVLDVTTPSLYWYFGSRQELVDAMATRLMGSIPQPPSAGDGGPLPWDKWLSWLGGAARRAMLGHRDGALLVSMGRPTAQRWDDVKAATARLAVAGFPEDLGFVALSTVIGYVIGTVLEEQQQAVRPGLTGVEEMLAPLVPHTGPSLDPEQRFSAGMSVIIDGLRSQLHRQGDLR